MEEQLLRQAADEVADPIAFLRKAAFELGNPGFAVRGGAALLGRRLFVRLGAPFALMTGGQAR
jgi:hypothetical protein